MNGPSLSPAPPNDEALREQLVSAGVRPTRQRMMVARCIGARRDHPTAEIIFDALSGAGFTISQATVYNTLGRLVAAGLLRTLQRPGEPVRYDPNLAPHHHFRNIHTGEIFDIPLESVNVQVDGSLMDERNIARISVFLEGTPVAPRVAE